MNPAPKGRDFFVIVGADIIRPVKIGTIFTIITAHYPILFHKMGRADNIRPYISIYKETRRSL